MIIKELEKIVRDEKEKGQTAPFIQNTLKEHLQIYVLYFIYTHSEYMKNLIFTGGTCLRHFFGMERLSEDIDFDYQKEVNPEGLAHEIKSFFVERYKFSDVITSIKQQGKQILLKFPVLKELGLPYNDKSDLLLVKIDISANPSSIFSTNTTSKSVHGFNFAAIHYDLSSLMAGKLHAVLTREYLRGKEKEKSIKGRDYFDLLWFLKKGVKPNLKRLAQMLGEKEQLTLSEVERRIDTKVADCINHHKGAFKSDLEPLIQNPAIIKTYVANYKEEYLRYKANSFAETVALFIKCEKCKKEFSAGLTVNKENLDTLKISQNKHRCPFCQHINKIVGKDRYILKDLKEQVF